MAADEKFKASMGKSSRDILAEGSNPLMTPVMLGAATGGGAGEASKSRRHLEVLARASNPLAARGRGRGRGRGK
jgi:hypothetical protein